LTSLRVGTRGSALALIQARWVAERLPGAEIVEITTSGDRARAVGDKSRWVDTIEAALVAGEIDLAVHSAKDVPGELAEGCELAATPPRAAAEDVLVRAAAAAGAPAPDGPSRRPACGAAGRDLVAAQPGAAALGSAGPRGRGAARERGTRLRKLDGGEVDAVCSPLRVWSGSASARGSTGSTSCRPPGRGRWRSRSSWGRAVRGRWGACMSPPPSRSARRAGAVRVLEASCHTPVGIHAQDA
jgi:hydroxymethylbilane synthase